MAAGLLIGRHLGNVRLDASSQTGSDGSTGDWNWLTGLDWTVMEMKMMMLWTLHWITNVVRLLT